MKRSIIRLSSDLERKRREIDQTDRRLLDLLNRRIRFVSEAITLKKEMGQKFRDLKREKQILEKLKLENKGPLIEEELKIIFRAIIGMCRRSLE